MKHSVKFSFNNEIRRRNVEDTKVESLKECVRSLWSELKDNDFVFKYLDDENDLVTVTSSVELEEAFSVAEKNNQSLKLTIHSIGKKINVESPVLHRTTPSTTISDFFDPITMENINVSEEMETDQILKEFIDILPEELVLSWKLKDEKPSVTKPLEIKVEEKLHVEIPPVVEKPVEKPVDKPVVVEKPVDILVVEKPEKQEVEFLENDPVWVPVLKRDEKVVVSEFDEEILVPAHVVTWDTSEPYTKTCMDKENYVTSVSKDYIMTGVTKPYSVVEKVDQQYVVEINQGSYTKSVRDPSYFYAGPTPSKTEPIHQLSKDCNYSYTITCSDTPYCFAY